MRGRAALPVALALLASSCVTEHFLELELRPPRDATGGPDVPADLVGWELRLSRLDGDARCPTVDEAAAARPVGTLAHVQTFGVDEAMGVPVGEVPQGRWALAAIGRSDTCEVRLYGCTEIEIGSDASELVTVDLEPQPSAERCGCRTCEAGGCGPEERECP